MPIAKATDAQYNAPSRSIDIKALIYLEEYPLTVWTDDYIVDVSWLEEAGADSSNPLGSISSNELTLNLINEEGIFSPTNPTGPYYGLIKNGVKIELYIRPYGDGYYQWDLAGTYYVTSWKASVTGGEANIIAHDVMQKVFNAPAVSLPVAPNVQFSSLYQSIFNSLNLNARIDESLTQLVQWSFSGNDPKTTLQDITIGALATCCSGRDGIIDVNSLTRARTLRAVLDDTNQVMSVSAEQSTIKNYGGVELTYNLPQWSTQKEILTINGFKIPAGIHTFAPISFTQNPVVLITGIRCNSDKAIKIRNYSATPYSIEITTENSTGTEVVADIVILGVVVDFIPSILTDNTDNLFKLSNMFIQDAAYAEQYKEILSRFVNTPLPTINASIRGNPLLKIGDKIQLTSSMYQLDFTGILQRAEYNFNGALSCEITLLDASIFTEVGD